MDRNRIEKGKFNRNAKGLGTVDEEMVRARAAQLAVINGRSAHNILSSDLEEARRELTQEQNLDPKPTRAEAVPEDKRWPGNPGSEGRQAETVPAPDEQTVPENLVQEGVEEAEHDQMIRATREGIKKDKQK